MTRWGMLLLQYMILLGCHVYSSCNQEVFFKFCFKSYRFGIKWLLTTSTKNGKLGKAIWKLGESFHKKMSNLSNQHIYNWLICPENFTTASWWGNKKKTPKKYITITSLKKVSQIYWWDGWSERMIPSVQRVR